jgi:hypothetical protein
MNTLRVRMMQEADHDVARGFESKDVEFQQEEAARRRPSGPALTPEAREREAHRRGLELALTRARADRASATNAAHQQMLDAAIRALEDQLTSISTGSGTT